MINVAAVLTQTSVVSGAYVVTGEAIVNAADVVVLPTRDGSPNKSLFMLTIDDFLQQVIVFDDHDGFLQQVMVYSNKVMILLTSDGSANK